MNVSMLLEMAADGMGDRIAIGQSARDGLTFSRLRELASAGPPDGGEGGVLALADCLSAAVPVALFSAAWSGLSYAPVNYRLPPAALADLVARLEPGTTICGSTQSRALEGLSPRDSAGWLAARAASADAARGGSSTPYVEAPSRPAVLLFTSGTSATPKAASLDHAHLTSYVFNTVEFASAGDDEAVLVSVPPFHIAGVAAVLSACYAGRRIVPLPSFSAKDWLATARRESVTHAFLVPTMLARIVAEMEADPGARVPSLRALSYGGARMPLPVLERALRLFPRTGFVNAYGLTETSATVAMLGPDDHRSAVASKDPARRARLASAGLPVPGMEVDIMGEGGTRAQPGEHGEIRIRGPQVSGAYIGQPSRVDGDGWLATGDIGWVDEDGYLFVSGRADDLIISGGENISPAEVEDALLGHPSVAAAAAVGVPDDEWGERVGVMIVLRPAAEVDGEAIAAWAAERLGGLKAPRSVVVREALPVGATGKILRRSVREELARRD